MRVLRAGVVVISLVVVCVSLYFRFYPRPSTRSLVTIEKGMSAEEVARMLKDKKLIVSKNIFLFLLQFRKGDKRIKAGLYEINPGESTWQIVTKLVSGRSKKIRVTVPEGFTAREISELIEELGLGNKNKFLQIVEERNLEGFLFPETYFFDYGVREEQIVNAMVEQFDRVFTKEMEEQAKNFNFTKREVVILASLIEKEAMKDEERPIVSAVFHNRLKKRWYLESCATVRYALGKYKEKLTYKDLKVDSPYNTYRHFGLPPGPICNPGLTSLNAALHPADTDLMFFVAQGEGTHQFSRYYNQHLEIQRKMRRKR